MSKLMAAEDQNNNSVILMLAILAIWGWMAPTKNTFALIFLNCFNQIYLQGKMKHIWKSEWKAFIFGGLFKVGVVPVAS